MTHPPDVEVIVPVYNEADQVESHLRRLRRYLDRSVPFTAAVTLVDNASTDGTADLATRLAADLAGLSVLRLDRKGRGGAIRAGWTASKAEVVTYMDVDLSTDLAALAPLVAPLLAGEADIAIGSRRLPDARVRRGVKREVISRAYLAIVKAALRARASDLQCGFKAMRTDVARWLLPEVEDNEWFFDTELLVLAERHGLRIREVPVTWIDDPDTRVHLLDTAMKDLRGVVRLRRSLARGVAAPRPSDR